MSIQKKQDRINCSEKAAWIKKSPGLQRNEQGKKVFQNTNKILAVLPKTEKQQHSNNKNEM